MLGCLALVLTAAWLLKARVALAQGQVINEIQIEGNQRVETDAIRIHNIAIHPIPPDEFAVEGYLHVHRDY